MPTFIHGKVTKFAISAAGTPSTVIDISNALKDVNLPRTIDTAETSAFGNTYKTFVQGLADATLTCTGQWATGTANDIDDLLSGLIGATAPTNFAYAPNGFNGTTGSPGITNITASATKPLIYGTGWLDSYAITSGIAAIVGVTFGFKMASQLTRITSGSFTPS